MLRTFPDVAMAITLSWTATPAPATLQPDCKLHPGRRRVRDEHVNPNLRLNRISGVNGAAVTKERGPSPAGLRERHGSVKLD